MKSKTMFTIAAAFITGIVAGVSVISLLSFTNASSMQTPLPGVGTISVTQAHSYFNNYYKGAQPFNGVLKGFTINKEQLQVLNQLSNENPALSGFRIYLGADESSARIGIVVGINNNGNDVVTSIFKSNGSSLSPCPPICDATSQISAQ